MLKQYARRITMTAAIIATIVICWWLWKSAPAKQETYRPEVRQADGSVVLEKKPDPEAKPKHQVPKGSKVERIASVTVRPIQAQTSTASKKPAQCPDVTVDLSIIKGKDGGRRIVASSPNGTVIRGEDIPVIDAKPPAAPKLWAIGLAYEPFQRIGGTWIDRDLGPFRLGAQINQSKEDTLRNPQYWLKAGLRF